jgi:broad specificity phosphatase PhoE
MHIKSLKERFMRLYIMRHGEAVQAGPDAVRPLTPKGRADTVKVAKFLQDTHSPVDAIGIPPRRGPLRRPPPSTRASKSASPSRPAPT